MSTPPVLPLHRIPFLDRLTGGGLPSGALTGLVGPSGGGKTLLAMQIAHALAAESRKVLYICLEYGNDLNGRLERLVRGTDFERLTPAEQQRRNERIPGISRNIQVIPPDRFEFSRNLELIAGPECSLLIIDQLELWIHRCRQTPDPDTISAFCTRLKSFARCRGIPVLLLHQTAAALKSESPLRIPQAEDAMHSRSFGQTDTDLCLLIGTLSKSGLCRIACPTAGRCETVWLDGDHALFRGTGPDQEYFTENEPAGDFLPGAWALAQGLKTPAEICAHLDGFASAPAPDGLPELPASAAPVQTPLGWQAQERLLSAAGGMAESLNAEHGKLLKALILRGQDGDLTPVLRFALWCRCFNRRDFPDLTADLEDERLWAFALRLDQQAGAAGQSLRSFKSGFPRNGEIRRLTVLDGKVHARWLRELWLAGREISARREAERAAGSRVICRIQQSGLGGKNDTPAVWEKACGLFREQCVSPEAFLRECDRLFRSQPWPASLPVLIKQIAVPPEPEPRYSPQTCEGMLRIMQYADLAPWELADLALHAGTQMPGLGFIPEFLRRHLTWKALGSEPVRQRIARDLKAFILRQSA